MATRHVQSFANNQWYAARSGLQPVLSAITGEPVAETSSEGLDFGVMANYARRVGGKALLATTFHDRAAMLKALAQVLGAGDED